MSLFSVELVSEDQGKCCCRCIWTEYLLSVSQTGLFLCHWNQLSQRSPGHVGEEVAHRGPADWPPQLGQLLLLSVSPSELQKYAGAFLQTSTDSFAHSWVYFTPARVNAPTLAAGQGAAGPARWHAPLPSVKGEGGSSCHLAAAVKPVIFVSYSIQPVGGFQCPSNNWGHLCSLLQHLGIMAEVTSRHCYLSLLTLAWNSLHASLTLEQ